MLVFEIESDVMLSNRMEGNKHGPEWENECVSLRFGTDRCSR